MKLTPYSQPMARLYSLRAPIIHKTLSVHATVKISGIQNCNPADSGQQLNDCPYLTSGDTIRCFPFLAMVRLYLSTAFIIDEEIFGKNEGSPFQQKMAKSGVGR